MKTSQMYCVYRYLVLLILAISEQCISISLSDHPSLWPGHMKPLGTNQKVYEIETLSEYPSAINFFTVFVTSRRPFLLKGAAKSHPALTKWTNDYLSSRPEAETELVAVEPKLIENRDAKQFATSFKTFIDTYHNKPIYLVNPIPASLLNDVLMRNICV